MMNMGIKTKVLVAAGLAAVLAAYLATTTGPSDWRYAKQLATNLPKMPFRYFV
ncbi:MAG: hypothetical protein AB1384_12190 [Actinomycetota bacterium]